MKLDSDRNKALQVGVLEASLYFSVFFRFAALSCTCNSF